MKIYIKCENNVKDVIGEATFCLDKFEERIYKEDALPVAYEYFKENYIVPYSELCCELNGLSKVTTTATFI